MAPEWRYWSTCSPELTAEARQDTLAEVLDRAGGRAGGSVPLGTAAQMLRSERKRA